MSIYQHFRPEEKEFIDSVMNWILQVEDSYTLKLTDFLDPRQQQILASIVGHNEEVHLHFFGGTKGVERQRALLYPEYYDINLKDFQICLYEISYPNKFITLDHRKVLGTLMSLGLKREKFGDILIKDERVQFVAAEEVSHYLTVNLDRVGKAAVSIKQVPFSEIIQIDEIWFEENETVSSLRLDTVIAAAFHISRQKAQTLVQQGRVKVNYKLLDKTSEDCHEGDTISVRGFGRCKVVSIDGKTKKDKWKLTIGKRK